MQGPYANIDERYRPQIVERRISADGARKYVLRLHDGALVESVGMPGGGAGDPSRLVVCFSAQSGCAMGCAFCATGKLGLTRNLEPAEMTWQVALVETRSVHSAQSRILEVCAKKWHYLVSRLLVVWLVKWDPASGQRNERPLWEARNLWAMGLAFVY